MLASPKLGRFRDIDGRAEEIVRAQMPGLFPAASSIFSAGVEAR